MLRTKDKFYDDSDNAISATPHTVLSASNVRFSSRFENSIDFRFFSCL